MARLGWNVPLDEGWMTLKRREWPSQTGIEQQFWSLATLGDADCNIGIEIDPKSVNDRRPSAPVLFLGF